MTILKIAANFWENDSRDKRELATYQELGATVIVMAKGLDGDLGREDIVDQFRVVRFHTKPLGNGQFQILNKILALFMWAHYAKQYNADVISGHDIIGLTIAWISTWFSHKKPKLIYDSHEFELGRNKKRNIIQKVFIKHLEKMLIRKCAFSIMVNDSISDEVQRIYHLKERPVVVRSTPNYWNVDKKECLKQRKDILRHYENRPESASSAFLVMYHGILTTRRGIESLLMQVSLNPNIYAFILGNGSSEYVSSLNEIIKEKNIEGRVYFHPAVPLNDLWKYVGAADLSLVIIPREPKSYYYALPNKFFESIQSLTPVLTSDNPELKRIVNKYKIGLTCNPDDQDDVFNCIERLRKDSDFYSYCKMNMQVAKKDLCWENEKITLIDAYNQYILNC